MTELKPVAYMLSDFVENDFVSLTLPDHPNNPRELYFKEQLQPRVKMTKREADEFKKLHRTHKHLIPIHFLQFLIDHGNNYPSLNSRYFNGREDQLALLTLWLRFDPKHPEETIEIVPEKKWFVRSKEQYQPDMDQGISESGYLYLTQGDIYSIEYYETTTFKYDAKQFDTKEQAEEWTNPLTEAVLLPVNE